MSQGLTYKQKIQQAQRRKEIIKILRKNPGATHQDMADRIGCNRATISKDLKAIDEELTIQNREDFMLHRDRILREIQSNKDECMRRLTMLRDPSKGSRWMEEWGKLCEKEIRMLGVAMPERLHITKEEIVSKEEKDKAIDAVIKFVDDDVVDVKPEKVLKQLEHKVA